MDACSSSKHSTTEPRRLTCVLKFLHTIYGRKYDAFMCGILQNTILDVKESLDRLLGMFVVTYEQLGTPAGRDLCYSCLEENSLSLCGRQFFLYSGMI